VAASGNGEGQRSPPRTTPRPAGAGRPAPADKRTRIASTGARPGAAARLRRGRVAQARRRWDGDPARRPDRGRHPPAGGCRGTRPRASPCRRATSSSWTRWAARCGSTTAATATSLRPSRWAAGPSG